MKRRIVKPVETDVEPGAPDLQTQLHRVEHSGGGKTNANGTPRLNPFSDGLADTPDLIAAMSQAQRDKILGNRSIYDPSKFTKDYGAERNK